jgi:asparagine synthase (glutamine-hydrolysing)
MREALELAVQRRIGDEGLTAVLMSGGLDSSSVAALCAAQTKDRVLACSATFPDHPATDERELIETLQRELAIPAITADIHPGGLLASVLASLAAWQMPLLGWGDFWTLPLMREAAARGARTMLDGDGGDQVFGARPYLLADRLRAGHPLQALALAHELPGGRDRPPRRAVARVLLDSGLAGALPYGLHRAMRAPFAARGAPVWLRPQATRDLLDSSDPLAWKRLDGPRWWAYDAYVLTRGIEEVGVYEHQRRRAALAGLDARHPLLDLDVVKLGLRQPPRSTLDPRFSRPLLRASLAGMLPDAVRLRPAKALFESLISDCLTGPDSKLVRELLTGPGMELGAYIDPSALERALFATEHDRGYASFHWMWQVWRLVTIECWLRSQSGSVAGVLAPGSEASHPRLMVRTVPGTAA